MFSIFFVHIEMLIQEAESFNSLLNIFGEFFKLHKKYVIFCVCTYVRNVYLCMYLFYLCLPTFFSHPFYDLVASFNQRIIVFNTKYVCMCAFSLVRCHIGNHFVNFITLYIKPQQKTTLIVLTVLLLLYKKL